MSPVDRRPIEAESLAARSRRGELSLAEKRQFDLALTASPTLRVAHQVGLDFDHASTVQTGDDDLIARASSAALARARALSSTPGGFRSARPRSRRLLAAAMIAAAMISATGIAAALRPLARPSLTGWFGRYAKFDETSHVTHLLSRQLQLVVKAIPHELHAPSPEPPAALGAAPADVPPSAPPASATVAAPARAPRANRTPSSSADLFRLANGARHGGDFARAKRLYTELIGAYPGSEEAELARVSLGKLLLAQGETSAAEREFGRYLAGGQGQLAEEALASQAQSFERMKRTTEEQRAWTRLLTEHPNSVYAAEAKTRLQALRRSATNPVSER